MPVSEVAAVAPMEEVEVLIEAPIKVAHAVKFHIGRRFWVKANAEKLAAAMRKEGFDATLHFQPHNGLIAVSMGGYVTESEARTALAQARRRGHDKAWLKRL